MHFRVASFLTVLGLLVGCGDVSNARLPGPTASQALTSEPEAVEFETPQARQELFRDILRRSQQQAGLGQRKATEPVLFALFQDGEVKAAPGLDARVDLLMAPDAGMPVQLSFDGRGQRWSEERRESLMGLSEREVVELVARSLLTHWHIQPSGIIEVDRAPGAPYAVAYTDGILRVNPAFVYMAAAQGAPSNTGGLQ
jgi:hypothetical protein